MGEQVDRRYRRSPRLLVCWQGRQTVLLHCETLQRFRIDAALIDVLTAFDDWLTLGELETRGCFSDAQLDSLIDFGVIEEEPVGPKAPGNSPGPSWDPVDLAAQRRGNTGGFRDEQTATRQGPAPLGYRRPSGPSAVLPAPARLQLDLSLVLAARRSVRNYGDRPMSLAELSTVLHHAARVTSVHHDPLVGEESLRPFASAGARSELEIYVVGNDVDGLEPGAHYYDPRAHDLVRVCPRDGHQKRLNQSVRAAAGGLLNRDPPVVLIITAVFARVIWKYRDMGLALIHKDAGCLLQNLYLVATAMGLAPCAIGGGEEVPNARWLGLDPLVESQVGCFLLGSRPETDL